MDREYELFEYRSDGSLNWRGLVNGLEKARAAVWLLADETDRECFAMLGNKTVLARAPLRGAKRIFQVAYGDTLAARARVLCRDGYDVTSVLGNEKAKYVLARHPFCDLFVVGHRATERVRSEMVRWLRENYPSTRIVALNMRGHVIDGLRYNAPYDSAAAWLPMISAAADQSRRLGQAPGSN